MLRTDFEVVKIRFDYLWNERVDTGASGKLVKRAISLAVILAQAVSENVRIDTYEKDGRRSGYLVIDGRTGRIDQYDARSNRIGYGQATPSGRIDLYGAKSNRTGYGTVTPNGNNGKR